MTFTEGDNSAVEGGVVKSLCLLRHACMAMARSERALDFAPDLEQLRWRHEDFWGKAACTKRRFG